MSAFAAHGITILQGDCLEVMRELEAESVDAVVTDPPAGISFMGRGWDGNRGGRDAWIAWLTEVLEECYRVLKPGAHALVWALPRTSHWTGMAIEGAGFEVRDRVVHITGQGFPKSLDVSKAIDKRPGVSRHAEFAAHLRERMAACGFTNTFDVAERVVGRRTGAVANWQKYQWPEAKWWPALRDLLELDEAWGDVIAEAEREVLATQDRMNAPNGIVSAGRPSVPVTRAITAPATPEAAAWEGWGTALKPAAEDWWMARKPLAGTVAANVLRWGTGGLNVDGCRVEGAVPPTIQGASSRIYGGGNGLAPDGYQESQPHAAGRWPANLVLDEDAAALLDAEVGERPSGSREAGEHRVAAGHGRYGEFPVGPMPAITGDTGGPSRFFYTAKAGAAERDGASHPTVKPLDLMRWLVRLVTPPNGLILDPFLGSGTTAIAAQAEGFRCIGIEREPEYVEQAIERINRRLDPANARSLERDREPDPALLSLFDVPGDPPKPKPAWSYPKGPGGSEPHHMERGQARGLGDKPVEAHPGGRWPSNVILDREAAAALDAEVGARPTGVCPAEAASGYQDGWGQRTGAAAASGGDSGGPSRYFLTVDPDEDPDA